MSKLKKIEKEIIEIKKELANRKTYLNLESGSQNLKDRLEILEKERQFIIDVKEPIWEKILWNIVTPIIVAVIITLITNKLLS